MSRLLREEVFTGKKKRSYRSGTAYHQVRGKNRKKIGRKCRACGGDPWPNWFFCPTCHSIVSLSIFQE